MTGLHCLLVLFAVVQVAVCQDYPQGPPPPGQGPPPDHKCARPPEGVKNPQDCCQVKPMFTEDDLSECGFKKPEDEIKNHGPPDCTKQKCLLKKYNIYKEDESIDYEAAKAFVDKWVESNPEFKSVAETAKNHCMGEKGAPGPPQICPENKMIFCTGSIVFADCPTWQDTDECKKLKSHIEECRRSPANFPPTN